MADIAKVGTKRYVTPTEQAEQTELFFEMLADQLGIDSKVLRLLASGVAVKEVGPVCIGYEALTIDNTSGGVGFTLTDFGAKPPDLVVVRIETAQIRFTLDGTTAPTTTVGKPVNGMGGFEVLGLEDIKAFKAIRTGSVSATAHCHYFRYED